MQLRGFSKPGSIISFHPIPTRLETEMLILMNSVCMSREVGCSVAVRLLCLLFLLFHHNGLQVVHLNDLSMGVFWCMSDSARVPSAARLTIRVYILRYK